MYSFIYVFVCVLCFFLFVCLLCFVWTDQHYKVSCTWEDRSVHTAWPSSWTVTDFTPDRITFLAISTPRPRIPAIRTSVVPIRCIASWPRTYLWEEQVDVQYRLYRTGKGDPSSVCGVLTAVWSRILHRCLTCCSCSWQSPVKSVTSLRERVEPAIKVKAGVSVGETTRFQSNHFTFVSAGYFACFSVCRHFLVLATRGRLGTV